VDPRPSRRRIVLLVVALLLVAVAGSAGALLTLSAGESPDPPDPPPERSSGARADREPGERGRCDGVPTTARRELRGMWITTVNHIDWPSRPGLSAQEIKAEYLGWLDLAQKRHHNAVFVHVRPSGDALWPSKYAPWSEWLTGQRGKDPGFDVLSWIVEETHARNLEFHAWFNPYRGGQPAPAGAGPDIGKLAADHPLRRHRDWAVVYPVKAAGSRLYFNPGIPQARAFVEDSILEAVRRYDIDGVHFDDFFYPYPTAGQDFPDDAAFARYGKGFASRAEWRRNNVNTLVREMSERIKAVKPWVKFGISPFGIWRNARTDPAGSPTRGLQAFDDIYADTRLWVRQQWLDYIVPQLYWHIGFDIADYAKLLPWWTRVVKGTRVQLYIGQADYRVGEKGAWSDPGQLQRQLALNRRYQVAGSVHFSATSVRADRLGSASRYAGAHYGGPALIPTMAHLPTESLPAPVVLRAHRAAGGAVTLAWRGSATAYAVYRSTGSAAALIATTRATGAGEQTWTDPRAGTGAYCVTALDRSWNEGPASAAIRPHPAE
jgi:uncharacterized lipoprotein YddW (UPF0748 family)